MQISKRIKKINRLKAQNIIEFLFIMPILFLLTLAIFEVALFWQETNAIYNLNAEINATLATIGKDQPMKIGEDCPAALKALNLLKKKDSIISQEVNTYNINYDDGILPFAKYKFTSQQSVTVNNETLPKITLWVDCRSPYEDGYTTQIEFFHKTMVLKATIPNFGTGEPIVIIPENTFVASPKLKTIKHY